MWPRKKEIFANVEPASQLKRRFFGGGYSTNVSVMLLIVIQPVLTVKVAGIPL